MAWRPILVPGTARLSGETWTLLLQLEDRSPGGLRTGREQTRRWSQVRKKCRKLQMWSTQIFPTRRRPLQEALRATPLPRAGVSPPPSAPRCAALAATFTPLFPKCLVLSPAPACACTRLSQPRDAVRVLKAKAPGNSSTEPLARGRLSPAHIQPGQTQPNGPHVLAPERPVDWPIPTHTREALSTEVLVALLSDWIYSPLSLQAGARFST